MLVKKSGFEPLSQSSKTWPGWGWTVHCAIMLLLHVVSDRHCLVSSEHCTLLRCSRLPTEPLML